jgi:phage shock protein A
VQAQQSVGAIEPSYVQALERANDLGQQLTALRARREDYARRRATLLARQRLARAEQRVIRGCPGIPADTSMNAQMLAVEEKIAEAEALTAAELSVSANERQNDEMLESFVRNSAVDAALTRRRTKLASR